MRTDQQTSKMVLDTSLAETINEFFDIFSSEHLKEHLEESFAAWKENYVPEDGYHKEDMIYMHEKLIQFLQEIEVK
jgi:hypothetical protein